MFTGIIENLGTLVQIEKHGQNRSFWVSSPLSDSLKIDQSLSHCGVCLTVEEVQEGRHRVTAVKETLDKSNLTSWEIGTQVNLERSLPLNGRLDGHFVQGHVDGVGFCTGLSEKDGSWEFEFEYPGHLAALLIEKGSIAVEGISLTAFGLKENHFRVAIIPYTFHHTNLNRLRPGQPVNLEFDLLGKYINRILELRENESILERANRPGFAGL